MTGTEALRAFDDYFSLFPWATLPPGATGFDLGCGSGRWARFVAPRVAQLHCIDASPAAVEVARRNLSKHSNCVFHVASVDAMPIADGTMDFGFSLGVLHHVPDTAAGIATCARKLKPDAPFLLYLYYNFENRSVAFRALWRMTDVLRRGICRLPVASRLASTAVIAAGVYWPLARLARAAERRGFNVDSVPLSAYRNSSFYTMRTDSYDRFATQLEQRFSRAEITSMMAAAGLERISFRDAAPFWCAIGYLRRLPPTVSH